MMRPTDASCSAQNGSQKGAHDLPRQAVAVGNRLRRASVRVKLSNDHASTPAHGVLPNGSAECPWLQPWGESWVARMDEACYLTTERTFARLPCELSHDRDCVETTH